MSASDGEAERGEATSRTTNQMSAAGRRRNAHLRVRVREDVLFYYRQLETAFARSGLPGRFVEFLVLGFWKSWAEMAGQSNACERIARGDRYECTSPVCERPSGAGSHHVRFRAHGGGDEDENLTSPCDYCHLEGVHGGRLRVHGTAPELVWQVGRTPFMEVRGRERRLLA